MKAIVAGASGAIGTPLVAALTRSGHEVIGISRSKGGAARVEEQGAKAIIADVLDRDSLLRAFDGASADAVIHEATALKNAPTHYRGRGITTTNKLRTSGTGNLIDVVRLVGAKRFVMQSMIFGYGFADHGTTSITEDAPFGVPKGGKSDPAMEAFLSAEQQACSATDIAGVALRYGFLYGPGPASARIAKMLRTKLFPIPRGEGGTLGWLHVDDAVSATVAALEHGKAGHSYNIVDDEPATWGDVFDAMAAATGAPRPPRLPQFMLRLSTPFFAEQMIDTSMRVSNAKAKSGLGWIPSKPTFRQGVASMA
ncbi:NAD-dependent epimerase/dehydratase family protein [Rhodococcus sp. NPDC058521]|uniref:NAD-dependent epimerase/dehydratase family protein n=1 Tax=Rhodococcus sp. NPDC058521 TaxID=3346536 RepID=UPI003648E9E3